MLETRLTTNIVQRLKRRLPEGMLQIVVDNIGLRTQTAYGTPAHGLYARRAEVDANFLNDLAND
jgi:hypothetical protein